MTSNASRYRPFVRVLLAIAGVVFCATAVIPLLEGDLSGTLTMSGLGLACLWGARTGRDPLDPGGRMRSFRVSAPDDDRADRDAETESP